MERFIYILALLLILPFGDRMGVGSAAYASFFEVQVPMSERSAAYGVRSATLGEKTALTDGHFHASVQPIDAFGHAYYPGQSSEGNSYTPAGPRRVGHDDDEDDPMMNNVAPVGNIPWFFLALLLAAYLIPRAIKLHRISRTSTFSTK